MDEYIEKYITDVLNSINEVESYFAGKLLLFEILLKQEER